jgi:Cytochrome b(C-terminal)/b6/petD
MAHPNLTSSVIFGLGWLYLILCLMNFFWAMAQLKKEKHFKVWDIFGGMEVPSATTWFAYCVFLGLVSFAHFTGFGSPDRFILSLPEFFKNSVDSVLADPRVYFGLTVGGFALMIWLREWWIKPTVAWILLNMSIIFLALSMTDWDFRQIVGKPDNVPIVGMLFLLGFFTWIYFSRAVDNDRRIAQGLPIRERENNESVLVWPDLVYPELICMIVLTVILVAWGIGLPAPLEEPANIAKTPNPSKAPWYFLGLQEMLVYYDPWLAGVVFPSVILGGLMALPFIDFNKSGNGYYTFKERSFAVSTFLFGFFPLWVALIVLGTFLRGPNWNFFGIYEFWDVHKLEALNNKNLSEIVWDDMLGVGRPVAEAGASFGKQSITILIRESVGLILTFLYLTALPPLMAATGYFRKYYNRMGFIRFMVFTNLILLMAALPIKMLLRWVLNLKYIVAIPEWFFNI